EVDEDGDPDEEDDDLDFDVRHAGSFDTDFAASESELIFASRMPEPFGDGGEEDAPDGDALPDEVRADDPAEGSAEAALEAAVLEMRSDASAGPDDERRHTGPDWAGEVTPQPHRWALIVSVIVAAGVCAALILMYFGVI
ncbi:MAG: hypothetical protein ABI333_17875, partial [bacterium]